MAECDWKRKISFASRTKIINKLMDTFQKHLGLKSPQNIKKLLEILQRFEAKALQNATDKEHYLKIISFKILLLESLMGDILATAKSGNHDRGLVEKEETADEMRKQQELYKLMQRVRINPRL
ncbi:hypothetical protein O6H91_05G084500 [Diphasiastrum complanatum]|uniref:Uncharacterized protein n=2 Tax=Diphasiastrum complanatum TaxID=34168 RepID=A0ACC2DQH2_DIPCM|nr:hypothetical protein O6H91_05G037700 [Diphasiastrum complanatum]KAJ7556449.1 hypothetical protein O6H91_05G084500 [Diphasiastrum complanatum]